MKTSLLYMAFVGVVVLFAWFVVNGYEQHNVTYVTAKSDAKTDFEAFTSAVNTSLKSMVDGVNNAFTQQAEEKVIDLPEDAGQWYLTVVYQTDSKTGSAADRRLRSNLYANLRLYSLIAQTKYYQFTPSDPQWNQMYSRYAGGVTPQIWLQTGDGAVVYKASGTNIPDDPDVLANEITKAMRPWCPICPRPRPKPEPIPVPVPVPQPVPIPIPQPPIIPDVRPIEPPDLPEPEPAGPDFPIAAGIALVVIAGLLGLFVEWKRSG